MKMFNTIAIEITAQCNRRCEFCPVAYNTRLNDSMDWELYQKIIQELVDIDYRGRIEFYIYNESTKDMDYLVRCLACARATALKATFMLATNGDYLRGPENILRLFECGLNQLLINCYSPGLHQKRLAWLEALPPEINRTKNVYAATGYRSKVIKMLDKSNPAQFGSGIFRIVNRAGNIAPFAPALAAPVRRMCVKPFRLLNINWRGQALVCCQDYHGDVAYGNVKNSTLLELWRHPVMNAYRRRLLQRDRTLPLCRKCDCHAGAYPGNVAAPGAPFASARQIENIYMQNLKERKCQEE